MKSVQWKIISKQPLSIIYGVLPEIIGKWYSRKPIAGNDGIVVYPADSGSSDESDEEDYEKLWCFCGQPSYGRMILCDNDCCPIQWFHCDCLRIRGKPKGKWFCQTVVQNRKIKAKRKRWLRSNEQIPYILLTLKLATY